MQEVIPVSRKNLYSLTDANYVRIEALMDLYRGQAASIAVGVAKKEHAFCVI